MIFFMRFKDLQAFVLLSALFASASIYTYGQSPLLSPQPRELHAGELFPVHTATVAAPSGDTEDFFAAQNLEAALTQSGLLVSPSTGTVDLTVHLLRDTSRRSKAAPRRKQALARRPHAGRGLRPHLAPHRRRPQHRGNHRPHLRRHLLRSPNPQADDPARRRHHQTLDRHHPRLACNEVSRRA